MKESYLKEMVRLATGLAERGIKFTFRPLYEGYQIVADGWDAICHENSYGNKSGLIEVMGTVNRNEYDEVEGYLTAETILKRIDGEE